MPRQDLEDYYREAESWAHDRERSAARSRRIAWTVAAVAGAIAFIEALALYMLIPLKREVPYTLLVDRQTGYVQAIDPLAAETIAPDTALTRSFLVQYVIARESFDRASLQDNYRKVGLWSAGEARERYLALMRAGNPQSPLATLGRQARIEVTIRSISSLSADTALVRFSTTRSDPGAGSQTAQHWASLVTWRYTDADMSAADRLINPLGFQVLRYRRDAETLPEELAGSVSTGPVGPADDPRDAP